MKSILFFMIGLIMLPINSISCPIDCVNKVCTTHTEHITGTEKITITEYVPVHQTEMRTIWHESTTIQQQVIVVNNTHNKPNKYPIKKPKPKPNKSNFHYNREWFPNGFCRITMEENAPNRWGDYWTHNDHVQVSHSNGNVIYNINDKDICKRYREEVEYNRLLSRISACCHHNNSFNSLSSNIFVNIINNIIPGWWETVYIGRTELIPVEWIEEREWEKDILVTDCVPIENDCDNPNPNPVPEPATLFLFGVGIASFGLSRKIMRS